MSTLSMPAQLARCSTTAAVRRPVKSCDEVDLRSMVKADHVGRGTDVAAYLSSMLARNHFGLCGHSRSQGRPAGGNRTATRRKRGWAPLERKNALARLFLRYEIGLPGHSDGREIVFTGNFLTVCRSPCSR
jgi:hypothetical protein